MVDWQAAQRHEAATWETRISTSVALVLEELADSSGIQQFISDHVGGYERAIDVGVGPLGVGWIGLFGHGDPGDLVGLDSLPRIRPDTGREELDAFLLSVQERITYVERRAEDSGLADQSFNLVVCDNVVDHVEDPGEMLRACRRLVRRDGHLAFGVNVFSFVGYLKWNSWTRQRQPNAPNVVMHPHSFTEDSAVDLVRSCGWRIVAVQRGRPAQRLVGHSYRIYLMASAR